MKNKTLIYGPMFAGKSDKLLSLFFNFQASGKKAIIFKPKLDTRSNQVISRTGIQNEAIDVETLEDIIDFIKNNHDKIEGIFIDETQFLKIKPDNLNYFFSFLDERKIILYVALLNKDYLGNNFDNFDLLKPYFDWEIILSAICHYCGKLAFKTIKMHDNKRVYDKKEIIEIEGSDLKTKYLPVCEKHFNKT